MTNAINEITRIVQAVSHAATPAEQVKTIVYSIQQVMKVDVCSLYLRNEQDEMVLVASNGLAMESVGLVRLPAGAGLVGQVAKGRHPVNLPRADKHPAYRYLPETGEEEFLSFCGVPLISKGEPIGVLVVQNRKPRRFSRTDEMFLVTLGMQLALSSVQLQIPSSCEASGTRCFNGITGAPGLGLGSAWLIDRERLANVPDASCDDPESEIQIWRQLLKLADHELEAEEKALGQVLPVGVASIVGVHRTLLWDPMIGNGVENEIRSGNWLPGALRNVINKSAGLFLAIEDPYLRARHEDLILLGDRLLALWRGPREKKSIPTDPVILVGERVGVSEIAEIPKELLMGIVSNEGASLSHTAIVANALGIPAVMGIEMGQIQDEDQLIVDGEEGRVVLRPSETLRAEFQRMIDDRAEFETALETLRDEPAVTKDGVRVRLMTNSGLLADIEPGLKSGAEGVGLYRTEIPFMIQSKFPSEEEQVKVYRHVLKAYAGKPVYMRILDVGGDKPLPYLPIQEQNPALGWRGIRFCLDNASVLMTQIRAMLQANEATGNLHILLPMVTSTAEILAFTKHFDAAVGQLTEEGFKHEIPRIGVMLEVPAAASMIGDWSRTTSISFVSIGSNDLSQYLLAMDRNNSRIAPRYDHVHPAVLRNIRWIIGQAREADLPLSLCGEMAADPVAVVLLVGMGVTSLSLSGTKLPWIKRLIRSISFHEANALADECLRLGEAVTIRELVAARLNGDIRNSPPSRTAR